MLLSDPRLLTRAASNYRDPMSFTKAMESAYGIVLPVSYRAFLDHQEYRKHPTLRLEGYLRGDYELDFTDELLADVSELGHAAGISDIEDAAWSKEYAGYVPLARLTHPDVVEPKMFLVLDARVAHGPVLLFHQDGFSLIPLAESFEGFVASLPVVQTDIARSFRPGEAPRPRPGKPRYEQPPYAEIWASYLAKGAKDDFVGALAELSRLDAMLPDEPRVLRAIAQVELDLDAHDRALAAINRALALESGLLYVFTKSDVLLAKKDYQAALATLSSAPEAGEDEGDRAERLARIAVCADLSGDGPAALRHFEASRALDPHFSFWQPAWEQAFEALKTKAG